MIINLMQKLNEVLFYKKHFIPVYFLSSCNKAS